MGSSLFNSLTFLSNPGLSSDQPEVIPETPTASNGSELQDGAEIGDGLGPLYSEGHTERTSYKSYDMSISQISY